MAHFHDNALIGASGQGGYQIERSLRFNSADSAYLNRTPASAGNRKTWTWSGWVKRSKLASGALFQSFGPGGFGIDGSLHFSGDTLDLIFDYNGGSRWRLTTTQVFRDPSAWYHLVVVADTTNATAGDRLRFYANGIRITNFSTANYPSLNADGTLNQAYQHNIGYSSSVDYFSGYLTEIHFIDGQALTPSSFGETDTITGVWKPKRYTGTYGTNGFYLKFADNSGTTSTTLGKDSSGNGNNWTPNNFSVTAGAGNDSLIDTPTPYADGGNGRGNYCTFNPVEPGNGSITFANGNLQLTHADAVSQVSRGTFAVSSGKWYWEVEATTAAGCGIGVIDQANAGNALTTGVFLYGYASGNSYNNGSFTTYGATFTNGDIIGVALDKTANTLTFYKNGVSQGTFTSSLTTSAYQPAFSRTTGVPVCNANFGQRIFSYTPPAGFLALNTQNLPEPSIKKPSSYMDTLLWTGDGSQTRSLTGLNFQPDLVWMKLRSSTIQDNQLYDAVRGAGGGKCLATNTTAAEGTVNSFPDSDYGYLSSFDSAGFSVNDGAVATTGGYVNFSGRTYVAWCWDESATPGFDIVTWTAQATAATVAHSLGVAPKFIIFKSRDNAAYPWFIYHSDVGIQKYLQFSPVTSTTNSTVFTTAPTSTVFDPGTGVTTGNGYNAMVAYLWSEVAGFSKFGSYTGNGSADGPFVFCGFRPRWVMTKRTDSSFGGDWYIYDTARDTYNVASALLSANTSSAEGANSAFDLTSNGFKVRSSAANFNASGGTYIFAAFSESAFKYSLAR